MPKQIQKTLQDYMNISKVKKPATPQRPSPMPSTSRSISSSTSWILRGCKHPRTPSFASDHQNNENETIPESSNGAATLADIDRFLSLNFKSLYENEQAEEEEDEEEEMQRGNLEHKNMAKPVDILLGSPRNTNHHHPRVDSSDSQTEDITSSSTSTAGKMLSESRTRRTRDDDRDAKKVPNPDEFITLLTYSHNPYDDFKKSMQEMMDARLYHNGKIDWEFMEELLFCFLNLNDKKSYRFILGAFADLIVVLRENSSCAPAKPPTVPSKGGRRCRID